MAVFLHNYIYEHLQIELANNTVYYFIELNSVLGIMSAIFNFVYKI